jgi:kinesin family protein 1
MSFNKQKINGIKLETEKILEHRDRILVGSSHMYVFINPKKSIPNEPRVTWEEAQKEIAEAKGFSLSLSLTNGLIFILQIIFSIFN